MSDEARRLMGEAGRARKRREDERGSIAIEFAIVMSALVVGYFSLSIVAGRILREENDVRTAAQAAARTASLHNDYDAAANDVESTVAVNLADSGVSCETPDVAIISDRVDFKPGGWVTVRVECTARSLGGLGLPDNRFAYEATETIDLFRGEP